MAAPESLLEMSQNFGADFKMPWLESEIVPMDIYTACSIGQYDVVQEFLKSDATRNKINDHNKGGWTPLMYAAYVGHDTIVSLLLDHGFVAVDARSSSRGSTALMLAASCGNEPVVYFLLQNRANINAMDANGDTALFYAAHLGHQNVVKMLIDSGAEVEKSENKQGLTPLLDTAKEGHEGIFNLLLQSGANHKAMTAKGEDARQIALHCGYMPIVNLIDMQMHKQTPHSLLRSEPGLGNELMFYPELGSSPDTKVNDWLGNYRMVGSPNIQDGPERFAALRNQKILQSKSPISPSTPIISPSRISDPQTITSPKAIPSTFPETHFGSYEDYFFANSGRTIKSASLENHFNDLALNGDAPSRDNSRPSTPTEYPSISAFLQDLKLAKYVPVFDEQEVDFETLLTLTDADLKEIGITLFGPRRKIVTGIGNWKESNPARQRSVKKLESEINELRVSLQNSWMQIQQYQSQCAQEQELRSVFEGYLVEERVKFQKSNAEVSSTLKQILTEFDSITKMAVELSSEELQALLSDIQEKLGRILKELIDSETPSVKKKPVRFSSPTASKQA